MTGPASITGSDYSAMLHGQHTPSRWLSSLYHPSMSPDHPSFSKIPPREQELVKALYRQYERWNHKLYFKRDLSGRLIAALNGYDFADKLASCMIIPNRFTKNASLSRCGL